MGMIKITAGMLAEKDRKFYESLARNPSKSGMIIRDALLQMVSSPLKDPSEGFEGNTDIEQRVVGLFREAAYNPMASAMDVTLMDTPLPGKRLRAEVVLNNTALCGVYLLFSQFVEYSRMANGAESRLMDDYRQAERDKESAQKKIDEIAALCKSLEDDFQRKTEASRINVEEAGELRSRIAQKQRESEYEKTELKKADRKSSIASQRASQSRKEREAVQKYLISKMASQSGSLADFREGLEKLVAGGSVSQVNSETLRSLNGIGSMHKISKDVEYYIEAPGSSRRKAYATAAAALAAIVLAYAIPKSLARAPVPEPSKEPELHTSSPAQEPAAVQPEKAGSSPASGQPDKKENRAPVLTDIITSGTEVFRYEPNKKYIVMLASNMWINIGGEGKEQAPERIIIGYLPINGPLQQKAEVLELVVNKKTGFVSPIYPSDMKEGKYRLFINIEDAAGNQANEIYEITASWEGRNLYVDLGEKLKSFSRTPREPEIRSQSALEKALKTGIAPGSSARYDFAFRHSQSGWKPMEMKYDENDGSINSAHPCFPGWISPGDYTIRRTQEQGGRKVFDYFSASVNAQREVTRIEKSQEPKEMF